VRTYRVARARHRLTGTFAPSAVNQLKITLISGAAIALVGRRLAERFWPGGDAIRRACGSPGLAG
jgi:hypothetical protein